MINASDVEYIAKNTGLSEERVIILTEQEKDFNLLINEISQKDIDDGLLTLSFPLYTKLSVFKITYNLNYHINEKAYVSETISEVFPKLSKDKIENTLIQEDWDFLETPNEELAQYYFVLLGIFHESLNRRRRSYPNPNLFFNKAKEGFYLSNKKDLANHLQEWIKILRRMREEYWN